MADRVTEAMVDAAAKHLRETMQACKKLTPWETAPKVTKKKWLALAAGTLEAALSEPEGWQDMESAPRDTEVVIAYWLWRNSISPGSAVVQSARLTEFHGKGIWSWVVSDNKHGPFPIRGWCAGDILGWRPLPAAPIAGDRS
jgi:hypothetical protein